MKGGDMTVNTMDATSPPNIKTHYPTTFKQFMKEDNMTVNTMDASTPPNSKAT
jgi:hypothetical protein